MTLRADIRGPIARAIATVFPGLNAALNWRSRIFKAAREALVLDVGTKGEMNVAASSEISNSICLAEQCRIAALVTAKRVRLQRSSLSVEKGSGWTECHIGQPSQPLLQIKGSGSSLNASDRPQQPAQKGADLLAAGPLGGTKHGGDEAALAVDTTIG